MRPLFLLILNSVLLLAQPVFAYSLFVETHDPTQGEDWGEVLLPLSDGHLLLAAALNHNRESAIALYRFNANGTLDTGFGEQGRVIFRTEGSAFVYGLAALPAGFVLAGYQQLGKQRDLLLIAVDNAGQPDPGFGEQGFVRIDLGANEEIHYLKVDAQQRLVVAGFMEMEGGQRGFVMRILPNGRRDHHFGTEGLFAWQFTERDRVFGLALDARGRMLVTGSMEGGEGDTDCFVFRLLATGNFDPSFGQTGRRVVSFSRLDDVCSSIEVQPDGKILVAGYAERRGRQVEAVVTRLDDRGVRDEFFGVAKLSGGGRLNMAHGLAVDQDGMIYVGGHFQSKQTAGDRHHAGVVRLTPKGELDARFGDGGYALLPNPKGLISSAETITLDASGRPWIGGYLGERLLLMGVDK